MDRFQWLLSFARIFCENPAVMQVTYELTQRDFFDSFIVHRNRTPVRRWCFRLIATIVFLFAGVELFMLLIRPNGRTYSNVAPLLGLAFLWGMLMWASPWWLARTLSMKQPSAQGPITLLLDPAGLHWRWNGGVADIEWKNQVGYFEAKKHFLIYSSPVSFHIVPKRALAPEQIRAVGALLAEYLPATNHK
jgi:hypothetical protein